ATQRLRQREALARNRQQVQVERGELLQLRAQLANALDCLAFLVLDRARIAQMEGFAEHFDERHVRGPASVRRTAALERRDTELVAELVEEAALSHSRLANDRHDAAGPA